MAHRLALAAVLVAILSAGRIRLLLEIPPAAPEGCAAEGRGVPPRHWLGCAADPGTPRGLDGAERLLLGLPLDPNTASARDLAFVPGLSPRLGEAVVADREERGPFRSVEDLVRVRGIGPKRLARAKESLVVSAP